MQKAHLCTYLAAGLEPRTFGFQAQVGNHDEPYDKPSKIKIFSKSNFFCFAILSSFAKIFVSVLYKEKFYSNYPGH